MGKDCSTKSKHETPEKQLKFAIADYMKLQYSHIPFRIEFDQLCLPIHIKTQMSRIKSGRGWPDIFIPYPVKKYHGLFIEIKKSQDQIYAKKGGYLKNKHLQEQINFMLMLEKLGYCCSFTWRLDHFQEIFKLYLNNDIKKPFKE